MSEMTPLEAAEKLEELSAELAAQTETWKQMVCLVAASCFALLPQESISRWYIARTAHCLTAPRAQRATRKPGKQEIALVAAEWARERMTKMPRYIDADAMIVNENEAYNNSLVNTNGKEVALPNLIAHLKINKLIEETPAVSVEPVVHCGECKLHSSCTFEETFATVGLAKNKRFCGAGTRKDDSQ